MATYKREVFGPQHGLELRVGDVGETIASHRTYVRTAVKGCRPIPEPTRIEAAALMGSVPAAAEEVQQQQEDVEDVEDDAGGDWD